MRGDRSHRLDLCSPHHEQPRYIRVLCYMCRPNEDLTATQHSKLCLLQPHPSLRPLPPAVCVAACLGVCHHDTHTNLLTLPLIYTSLTLTLTLTLTIALTALQCPAPVTRLTILPTHVYLARSARPSSRTVSGQRHHPPEISAKPVWKLES
jgi:hypothetical protein